MADEKGKFAALGHISAGLNAYIKPDILRSTAAVHQTACAFIRYKLLPLEAHTKPLAANVEAEKGGNCGAQYDVTGAIAISM